MTHLAAFRAMVPPPFHKGKDYSAIAREKRKEGRRAPSNDGATALPRRESLLRRCVVTILVPKYNNCVHPCVQLYSHDSPLCAVVPLPFHKGKDYDAIALSQL